jgi:RND family efflux transporter MFP subunit
MAVGIWLALSGAPAQAQSEAVVSVDEVRSEAVSQTFPVIGRLIARHAGVVAAQVSGPVAEMKVEVGDRVEAGEVIAVLVRDRLRAEREQRAADVAEQRAKLAGAMAEMQLKEQELARLERLKQGKSAAFRQALFDDKKLEAAVLSGEMAEAQARLKRALAQLQRAEIDLRDTDIKAPFAGVVALRHTEVGAFVTVGAAIATLINDAELEIEADVPADRIRVLRRGTRVDVTVDDDTHQAVVRAVIPQENPLTRTRAVRFTPAFETAGAAFAANQSVTLQIPISRPRDVVSVHKDAVLNRQGNNLVYVVKDGAANVRPVTIGEAVGERFIVEQGLEPGEIVVVRGNERLFPGQPVRF